MNGSANKHFQFKEKDKHIFRFKYILSFSLTFYFYQFSAIKIIFFFYLPRMFWRGVTPGASKNLFPSFSVSEFLSDSNHNLIRVQRKFLGDLTMTTKLNLLINLILGFKGNSTNSFNQIDKFSFYLVTFL